MMRWYLAATEEQKKSNKLAALTWRAQEKNTECQAHHASIGGVEELSEERVDCIDVAAIHAHYTS